MIIRSQKGSKGEKLKAMEESSVVDKDFKVLTDDELIELSELDPVKHAQYVTDLAIHRVNEKRQADAQAGAIQKGVGAIERKFTAHQRRRVRLPEPGSRGSLRRARWPWRGGCLGGRDTWLGYCT